MTRCFCNDVIYFVTTLLKAKVGAKWKMEGTNTVPTPRKESGMRSSRTRKFGRNFIRVIHGFL